MGRHPYEQIVDDLARAIEAGRYRPGDRVPSESELADRYEVSKVTSRSALHRLVTSGMLTASPGKGMVVRAYRREPVDAARLHDVERPPVSVESLGVVPGALADLLAGRQVIRRRTVAGMIRAAYYPREVVEAAPVLGWPMPLDGPDVEVLHAAGLEPSPRARVRMIGRMPSREETTLLTLREGTPVLEQQEIVTGLGGRVLVVRVAVLAGDRHLVEFAFSGGTGPDL